MAHLRVAIAVLVLACSMSLLSVRNQIQAAEQAFSLEVLAEGLVKPRGLAFGPDGSLYVAEAGNGGALQVDFRRHKPHTYGLSGRLTRFAPDGARTTVVDQLPSLVTAEDEPVGPASLAFLDDQLYLLTAAGGWEIGDPEYHSRVLRVDQDGALTSILDYSAYLRDHPTQSRLEDPRADVPMGMPFGMTSLDGRLFVTDGNWEQILAITPSGDVTRVIDYPKSNRALTGITAGPDQSLYVSEYAANQVSRVTTDGHIFPSLSQVQVPIAVAFDSQERLYVLEYRLGQLIRVDSADSESKQVIATGLFEATAMTFGPDGNLYISYYGGKQSPVGRLARIVLAPGSSPTIRGS